MPTTPSGCGFSRLRAGRNSSAVAHAARPHPALKMAARVEDRATGDEDLGDPRLLRGAAAEVGVDRRDERVLVVVDQR